MVNIYGKKFKVWLKEALEGKIPKELLPLLPSSYQLLGKILLVKLKKPLLPYKKIIGEEILKHLSYVKTVCVIEQIEGEKRVPKVEVIAGEKNTETVYKEHGILYKFDVTKIMFSKGNKRERLRITKKVRPNEVVVDMFAGIGYFSLPIAKYSKAKMVYAIDINKDAIRYLKENIKLNELEGKIVPILGDNREVCYQLENVADRIIMGYLKDTWRFLKSALIIAKDKAIIHYHDTCKEEELFEGPIERIKNIVRENNYKVSRILYKGIVKSYSPRIYHIAIDFSVKKISS